MPVYTVTWKADIEAGSPEEAAEIAERLQKEPSYDTASFFVCEKGDTIGVKVNVLSLRREKIGEALKALGEGDPAYNRRKQFTIFDQAPHSADYVNAAEPRYVVFPYAEESDPVTWHECLVCTEGGTNHSQVEPFSIDELPDRDLSRLGRRVSLEELDAETQAHILEVYP